MKKTTKFLLVLAAVVAMTIGAVSTVMAADDVVIAKWAGDEKNGYTATDTNGNSIKRGWAVDKESGIWYYFVNSKMATNRFVTTGNNTYYVNADGAMHTGWFEFDAKTKVSVNGALYDNVAAAFGSSVGSGTALAEKTRYATVWCYFDENGVMVTEDWAQVDGIWYYMDGPFCLIGEWKHTIVIDAKKGTTADYGFDQSGAMLAGWIAYTKTTTTTTSGQNQGTPYGTSDSKKTTTEVSWVYYAKDGKLANKNGWLKDANGDWFFLQVNDEIGVPVAVTSTYIKDVNGYGFYFDESGYMYTEAALVVNGGSKGKTVKVMNSDANYTLTAGTDITVAKNTTMVLTFNANGQLITGQQGLSYYENLDGNKYTIGVTVATTGAINVAANAATNKYEGAQWTESFLYVWTNSKGATIVNYYVDGEMVKLAALPFGDKVLAFDKDGKVISKETEIDGVKYLPSTETLIDGVPFAVIK